MGILERDFNVSDEEADFGSFLVDRMHMHLSPMKKPYENLKELFNKILSVKDWGSEEIQPQT